jgi:purine-binding chemotaxis protein CheW
MSAPTIGGRYCSFYLGDLLFGIEVERVQEVIRPQTMTRVPLASSVVQGLINIRGQIVAAIDLARRLELESSFDKARSMNVVITLGRRTLSLLVDRIGEVVECDAAAFEPPPETLSGSVRGLIRGAFKLEERLLLLLDTERIAQFNAAAEEHRA